MANNTQPDGAKVSRVRRERLGVALVAFCSTVVGALVGAIASITAAHIATTDQNQLATHSSIDNQAMIYLATVERLYSYTFEPQQIAKVEVQNINELLPDLFSEQDSLAVVIPENTEASLNALSSDVLNLDLDYAAGKNVNRDLQVVDSARTRFLSRIRTDIGT